MLSSSAQGFARRFELVDDVGGECVVPSIEDSKMSSVDVDDRDAAAALVRVVERSESGELDSTTLVSIGVGGGGGEIASDISDIEPTAGGRHQILTTAAAVSGPQPAYMEFVEWLKRSLDEYGLEPILYARCALSILRQPPEPVSDMVYQSEAVTTKYLSIVRGNNQNSRNNNSAPSSRKNSFGSLALALADYPISSRAVPNHDGRKQALLDCLKTMNSDKVQVKKFVDEIVHRYTSACKQGVFGEKQNDSVDSGVCPSPEESFQNYDEAFPPLAGDCSLNGTTFDEPFTQISVPRPARSCASSSLNGKRPADATTDDCQIAPDDHPEIAAGDIEDQLAHDGDCFFVSSAYSGGGDSSSPVKRLKLNAAGLENERQRGARSLKSCPDFVLSPSAGTTEINGGGGGPNGEKRATFCCPVVKKQQPPQNWPIIAGGGSSNHQPQFVIPKCWTVGSWPSRRYDRSTKPVGDVPFWSCSEWFCTIHKRLEFGMLNAKINGDTNSLAGQPLAPGILCKNASAGQQRSGSRIDSTTPAIFDLEALMDDNNVDVDIFEIEPVPPPLPLQQQQQQIDQQQNWMFGRTTTCQQQQSNNNNNVSEQLPQHVLPDMFDAPKFILRIINEDDAGVIKEPSQFLKGEKNENDPPPPPASLSNWTPLDTFPGADAMIASLHSTGSISNAQQCGYADDDNSLQWPPQPPATTCSKFSFGSLVDAQGEATAGFETILPVVDISGVTNSDFGFCLPKCDRFPSVGRQQHQRHQNFVAPTATFGSVGDNLQSPTTKKQTAAQQLQQQQADPNKDTNPKKLPQSMAVPIKESTHFIPIRSESMEDAYYLKPGFDEFGSEVNDMEGYYIYHHDEGIAIGATAAGQMESGGGRKRRSLVLKFRATNPDKMCQTEEQQQLATTNFRGDHHASSKIGPVSALLEGGGSVVDQEFEIWSYQLDANEPMNVADVTSLWTEKLCGKMPPDTMYNDFSSRIDGGGWYSDLLGGGGGRFPAIKTEKDISTSGNGGVADQYTTTKQDWGECIDAGGGSAAQKTTTSADGQQQLDKWQKEDERYEDSLLRYVSSISLISPLDVQSTTTTTRV